MAKRKVPDQKQARKQARKVFVLRGVAKEIGALYDGLPECFEAAALFIATCRVLGYNDAVPQPVAFIAQWDSKGIAVASSEIAAEVAVELGAAAADAERKGMSENVTDWGGHMIVLTSDPAWIWDPTFAQFRQSGLPDTHLCLPLDPSTLVENSWTLNITGDGDLIVRYERSVGPQGWEVDFERFVDRFGDQGKALANAALPGRVQ